MVKEQLANLSKTPGVLGSCLCNKDGGVLTSMMPDIFDPDSVKKAGRAAAEALKALETFDDGTWELDFVFEQYFCVVRPAGDHLILLLCEPTVSMPVLKLSINVVVKRIAEASPEELAIPPLTPEPPMIPHKLSEGDDYLDADRVQKVIQAIRAELHGAFGSKEADTFVDETLAAVGLNLEKPARSALRMALNHLLESALSQVMGKTEATRWLNQLIDQQGLARKPAP
jgi:predicted regulator of Ras-like GTPase activity (Roadblock/LC7/MglB family)